MRLTGPLTYAMLLLCLVGTAAYSQTLTLTFYSGEELFQRYCSACHGTSGRGDGPVASSLATAVPDLTTLSQRHGNGYEFPAAWVRETIDGRFQVMAHGPRSMPVWGYEFWIEEGADAPAEDETRYLIERLVDYLSSIQVPPENTLAP